MPRQDALFQRLYNLPYGYSNTFHLFDSTKNSKSLLQRLRLQVKIPAHNGCVNSICWNETGKYLLSGSDDQHLCITHAYTHTVLTYIPTGHRANIFSAKFLPGGDNKVISCSGDGIIIYSDLENPESSLNNKFSCHFGTAYEIMTVPNEPNTFLSCGEDGTVRWFDLRTKTCCSRESCKEDVLLNCYCAVTALAVNPVCPYQLAVGCADASVRVFDRRMLCTSATGGFKPKSGIQALMANLTVPEFTTNHRITSLGYSHDGQEILVSYSSDFIYLFDVRCSFNRDPKVINSPDKDSSKSARNKSYPSRPLMKRLRVRGDWSDTGPNARPESESRGEQQPRSLHASLMQRMSDVLTSMYNQRSRGQQNTAVSSSSSHSEDSEMDDTDEHETEEAHGSSSNRSQTLAGSSTSSLSNGTQQSQVPTFERSERIGETIKEEEDNDDEEEEETRTGECDLKQQTSPSSNLAGIDISTIKVSPSSSAEEDHISSTESQKTVQTDTTSEVLNLSLQNIKQELSLSKKALNDTQEEKSVINGNSTVQDSNIDLQDIGNSSKAINDDNELKGAISVGGATSTPSDAIDEIESPENICDNQQPMDFTPSAAQTEDNCDAINTSAESNETDRGHESSSSTVSVDLSRDPVPDIFVATVPPTDEAASAADRQNPSHGEGQMTFMMEMDAWDVDSEDDTHSQSSYRRLGLEVPESVASAFKEEREMTEEDLEKEEQERMSRVPHPDIVNKYTGHRNARTMIKEATFWGDNFIMSGSDCGHIFVWDRYTSELVMLMEADHHVVNCLQPHPFDPILASSGIDYDIKIWAPLREEPFFDEEKANEIIKRNRVMLEETRDTITVPASFMIRMLASLNHITSGSGWRRMARHLREGARRNR